MFVATCFTSPGEVPWSSSHISHHLRHHSQTHKHFTLISWVCWEGLGGCLHTTTHLIMKGHIKTISAFLWARNVQIWDLSIGETVAGSSISVNNTRRTIRSLSVFKMGIEIKREFPFKVYLRNVNQPGIWGLINFHFPNQIYTIQAVLCTLHLGSCIQAGFLCLFSSQARWISEVRFVNTIILVVQC